MSRPGLLWLVIACAAASCKSDKAPTDQPRKPAASTDADSPRPPSQANRRLLVPMAMETLAELERLETEADVTCWTSFRQLDWYIAEKTYSEFATVAKVTAIKGLTRALWVRASSVAGDSLAAADVANALKSLEPISVSPDKSGELAGFANDIGLRNYTDYQKTAEHWRIVLAVVSDEIFYGSGGDKLAVASGEALVALADAATLLSLHLLKRSSARASSEKAASIEAPHVKEAFSELAVQLGLTSTKRPAAPLFHADSVRLLAPITRGLIKGKKAALLAFNRATGDLAADLSRVSEYPLDADAAKVLYASVVSFVRFVSSGADPMRADTYIGDASLEGGRVANKPYLEHVDVHNVVEQLFPHRVLANGDVVVRFEPNPGPLTVGKVNLAPFEIRLLDHRMNGVRDSAVHWQALDDVHMRRPYAIDPFAAEYLSEVVSMMVTLTIERSVWLAKETGKKRIDRALVERVLAIRSMVQAPMPTNEKPEWDRKWAAARKRAIAGVPRSLFADVTARSGLPKTVNASKNDREFNIQKMMGAGVAVGDVNGDGYADVYIAGEELGRLMINGGKAAPLTFRDETEAWKLPSIDDGRGALLFDLEGDGDLDLLALRDGHPSRIFRNNGKTFSDATKALSFRASRGAHSAHVFDYDGDGDLDIYVGYYGAKTAHEEPSRTSKPSLDGRNGSPNQLWRNDGDRLSEVAAAAGVADVGWTLAIGSFDYELDGDLDLYLANDFGANALYRNDGGKFTDVTTETGTGDRGSGMNVEFTDINGDGYWDLYVTNIDMFSKRIKVVFPRDESTIDIDRELAKSFQYLTGNKLYVSVGKAAFESGEQDFIEPGDRGWGWDALFFDYDHDGDDDLYLTNGWLEGSYAGDQKNQMFLFDEVFHLAPASSAEAVAGNTRSVAAADFDRDGDIDLLLNQFRRPPLLLENKQRKRGGWVRLSLKGPGANPRGIGARLTITAAGKTIRRQVTAGRGYISQTESDLHAGVGRAATVDVEVNWPDGKSSVHKGLVANAAHVLSPSR